MTINSVAVVVTNDEGAWYLLWLLKVLVFQIDEACGAADQAEVAKPSVVSPDVRRVRPHRDGAEHLQWVLVQVGRLVGFAGADLSQFFKTLPPVQWLGAGLVLFAIPVLHELSLEIVRNQALELRADVVPHEAESPASCRLSLRRSNEGDIESAAERDRALAVSRDYEFLMMHAQKMGMRTHDVLEVVTLGCWNQSDDSVERR